MQFAKTPRNAPEARLRRLGLSGAALIVLAAVAGGCSTTATSDVALAEHDYRKRHPIMLSQEPESFHMQVGMRGPALSPEIETALNEYVAEYQQDGTGSITIQTPTAAANEQAARSTGQALHYALVRAGVPQSQIQVAPYYFGDHAQPAPLRLSYLRVKAVAPKCGLWPEDMPNSHQNSNMHNFGCAYQQNLAAMVANPADFIRPRPLDPANGARRANVINIYATVGNIGWAPNPASDLLGGSVGD